MKLINLIEQHKLGDWENTRHVTMLPTSTHPPPSFFGLKLNYIRTRTQKNARRLGDAPHIKGDDGWKRGKHKFHLVKAMFMVASLNFIEQWRRPGCLHARLQWRKKNVCVACKKKIKRFLKNASDVVWCWTGHFEIKILFDRYVTLWSIL